MMLPAVISLVASAATIGAGLAAAFTSPRGPAQLSLTIGLVLLGAEAALQGAALSASSAERAAHWERIRFLLGALLPATWLLFANTYARGNHREFLDRWRPWLLALLLVPVAGVAALADHLVHSPAAVANGDERVFPLGGLGWTLCLMSLVAALLVLMSLERTYRASRGTMRWRLKFMVLGVGLIFAVRIYAESRALLTSSLTPEMKEANSVALLLGCLLMGRAVLRDGLIGAEVYPSHRLLERSLTALLVGIYLVAAGFLTKLVLVLAPYTSLPVTWSFVLLSLVGLVSLLLSDRLRHRLKSFVSRHLQRPQHDYRELWRTFSGRTASLTHESDLCAAIAEWVSDTFHVLSTTLLLAEATTQRFRVAASTAGPSTRLAPELMPEKARAAMDRSLLRAAQPIDLDRCKEGWVAAFQRCHSGVVGEGGGLLVPLIRNEELIGLLVLRKRVDLRAFTVEDLELLGTVADHAAASLAAAQLHARLLESREMEAFQTMSAFFVHDLKNTASTLSLMMQNLPAHFENPAFREDALQAVSKGVARINELIRRLGTLRQDGGIRFAPADLSATVSEALRALPASPGIEFIPPPTPLPAIRMDAEKIQKVVTNILQNAREAAGDGGRIEVRTGFDSRWAWVTVRDDGPGIDPDFLAHSMFRPFQTTKKKGVGIGMFLSKTMVDAHQGRIDVETEPGKGTTFRVLLPIRGRKSE